MNVQKGKSSRLEEFGERVEDFLGKGNAQQVQIDNLWIPFSLLKDDYRVSTPWALSNDECCFLFDAWMVCHGDGVLNL
jgi:hypothetical protein